MGTLIAFDILLGLVQLVLESLHLLSHGLLLLLPVLFLIFPFLHLCFSGFTLRRSLKNEGTVAFVDYNRREWLESCTI
jgi:hypothetical protein